MGSDCVLVADCSAEDTVHKRDEDAYDGDAMVQMLLTSIVLKYVRSVARSGLVSGRGLCRRQEVSIFTFISRRKCECDLRVSHSIFRRTLPRFCSLGLAG